MIPKYYEFQNSAKILSGEFAIENIPHELKELGSKNVMILTDKTLEKIGTLQTLIDSIIDKGINIADIFTDIPPDSSLELINVVAKRYNELKCDGIIALGGGSVIDTAKGTRMILSQEKENLMDLAGCELISYYISVGLL